MITCTSPRKTQRPSRSEQSERPVLPPPKPDKRLWEKDPAEAFEAGVRWFLAVSRVA
jgi:hypothetical protein